MKVELDKKLRQELRTGRLEQALATMRDLNLGSEEDLRNYCQDSRQTAHNRLCACSALAGLVGQAAVPFLLKLAEHFDRPTVDAALFGLRCIGTRRATRLYIRELNNESTDSRRQVALDMIRFVSDPRAERAVAHVLLTDNCALTRELAAEVLSSLTKGRRSVRALVKALSDPVPEVRWWALGSLSSEPNLNEADLEKIRALSSDQASVSTAESPEQATVAWAACDALKQQVAYTEDLRLNPNHSVLAHRSRDVRVRIR